MSFYPPSTTPVNHVAPAPRRVRGFLDGNVVFDTTRARYLWEWPHYPSYYIPRTDVRMELLTATGNGRTTAQGETRTYTFGIGRPERSAVRHIVASVLEGITDTLRFRWDALDQWFEEDEEVFVHPRSPYTRVDALRSTRTLRIEFDGTVLATSVAPVMVFETGLPTRYYLDQRDVRYEHLVPSVTRTQCPYKGRTTDYWSVRVDGSLVADVAWTYAFPTRQLLPIAGLVAFLNEKVDIWLDGVPQARPTTHMG